MKLINILQAALFLSVAGAVQANTITNWGVHGPLEIGFDNVAPGLFEDVYEFSLPPMGNGVTSVTVANDLLQVVDIANGSVSLYQGDFGNVNTSLIGTYSFNGATGDTPHSYGLTTGDYFYTVSGDATGALGGVYTLTSTPAVPEPETYALLLIGAVAVSMWRKKQ